MTRATQIANILKKLGDAHYQAADELLALASNESEAPVSVSGPAAASPLAAPATTFSDGLPIEEPFSEELFDTGGVIPTDLHIAGPSPEPEGHDAICPAHHKPFVDGKFGPYCPGKGIDPAWTNKRGYCTVNPKNVATYLRVKAAA